MRRPGGKLLLQIINYDRILDQGIGGLPEIRSGTFRFERIYHVDKNKQGVGFETILHGLPGRGPLRNRIWLYPLRKKELEKLLHEAGFRTCSFHGSFGREHLQQNSIPLVAEAQKPL